MSYDLDRAAQQRLETYFVDRVGPLLRNKNQRASFALYAVGILGEGERKSAEPIAARTVADPDRVDPMHQKLLHFLANARWDAVRRHAARYGLEGMVKRGSVTSWSVDDTGLLQARDSFGGGPVTVYGLRRQGDQLPGGRHLNGGDRAGAPAGGHMMASIAE